MAAGDYAFGSFLLEDPATGYSVIAGEPPSAPLTVARERVAVRDGSVATYTRFEEITDALTVMIKGSSFQATEDLLDALLLATGRGEQNLKLGFQDERYWLARFQGKPRITKITGLYYHVGLDYVAPSGHAYAASASSQTSLTALSNVSGDHYRKVVTATLEGSIYNWPVYTIDIPAGGPYGTSAIWIVNSSITNTPQLTITRTFAASDHIVIDTEAQSVTVNGVEVDYSGQFPPLDPREDTTNDVEIHSTSTSTPTLEVEIAWRDRYR